MTIRANARSLALAATLALSAAAVAAETPVPVTGRVQSFEGCLTQEPTGTRYFDLEKARTGDEQVGTVRLIGSVTGITPKEALHQKVQVNGYYLAPTDAAPEGFDGRVVVSDARVLGGKCS